MPNATASGSDAANGNAARSRAHNQGNQERKYTPEQKAAVLRIRACRATAFYEILDVQKTCTDTEVKKAYRKQSLLTHPDKNGHEHADEAFKMVSRAFSVLGDKEKRDKFDRFGTDPDSRFESARAQAQNPYAGFANRGAAGRGGGMGGGGPGMWEDEISPEEMFARFFGGGGFGGPFGGGGAFDTGPQFVFNFGGGPGIRVHQFGGARPRGRPRNPEQQEPDTSITSTLLGLLPILLLFIFPLLTSLFSGGASQASMPNIALEKPSPPYYTMERSIPVHNVKYFVNPQEVAKFSDSKLHQLDKQAEVAWRNLLKRQCENELHQKRRMQEDAQGWFFQDPVKMEMANNHPLPSCERLTKANQKSR